MIDQAALGGDLQCRAHQLGRDAAAANLPRNAGVRDGHDATAYCVIELRAMTVNLGGELLGVLIMANGAHGPLGAPLDVPPDAPRVSELGGPAVSAQA